MRYTKLGIFLLCSSLIVIGGSSANANEVDVFNSVEDNMSVPSEGASTASVKAKVEFYSDNTPTDPDEPIVVDPNTPQEGPKPIKPPKPPIIDDGDNEGDGDNGDVEYDNGLKPRPGTNDPFHPENNTNNGVGGNGTRSFNISWASNFNFGHHKISSGLLSVYAMPLSLEFDSGARSENIAPFVQVTDNRGGDNGWSLSVRSTPMKSAEGDELKGSSIVLKDMTISNALTQSQNTDTLENAPQARTNIDISSGSEQVILQTSEENGSGRGVWNLSFNANHDKSSLKDRMTYKDNSGVIFSMPANANPKAKVVYASNVIWTLNSTP